MWDVIGAAALIALCLIALSFEAVAWFGGALAEKREQPGWVPAEPSVFDVADVAAYTAICADCGQAMGDVVLVRDGAGCVQPSGVAEAAEVHRWHTTLDCTGVRA